MRSARFRESAPSSGREGGFPFEVALVWLLFAFVSVELLATYSRLPAQELYNFSGSGLTGGASRAVVFLNFPAALVAIAILALVADRLSSRWAWVVAAIGIVLSAAVFWPGVVTQSDLDARPVNTIAALGVLTAVALSAVAARRLRRLERPTRRSSDWLRLVVGAAALVLAVPYIGADLGFYFNGVPVLGTLYQTGELRSQPSKSASPPDRFLTDVPSRPAENPASGDVPRPDAVVLHPAVHHGHHHGMDGALLVFSALLLSRLVGAVSRRWLAGVLGAYLALMLCYGAGILANDFWLEQVVKRGWTNWEIPDVTTPKASVAWGIIVLCAAVLWAISSWHTGGRSPKPTPARPEPA